MATPVPAAWLRWTSALGTALLVACSVEDRPPVARADGPNVILIVVDTLRADHLTQFGYDAPTSTGLDLLTDRSTSFRQTSAPAPWTVPSVTSILTGLLPARHRVDQTGSVLADRFDSLPEHLQRAGWNTGAFSFNKHVSEKAGFDQGFDHFVGVSGNVRDYPDTEVLVTAALAWIREEARRPFFLYLQPMNVHGPYRVPADRRGDLLGRPPSPGFEFGGDLMDGILRDRRLELRAAVTPEVVTSLVEQYDTAIRYTADELGRLFSALDRAGLLEPALVVLTSDHGEELFDRGGFAHGFNLNHENLHVPLFIKLPGQREAREVDTPVSLVDLSPTILDVLGLPESDASSDGRSLLPLLEGGAVEDRAVLAQAINPKRCNARSLREGDFQLLAIDQSYDDPDARMHLYDLSRDPGQREDLSAREPVRTAQMRARLEALYDALPEDAYPREHYEIDEATRDALQALGYEAQPE